MRNLIESNIYSRIQNIKRWRLFRNNYPSAPYHTHQEFKLRETSSGYSPAAIYEDRTPDFGIAEQAYIQQASGQHIARTPEPLSMSSDNVPHSDMQETAVPLSHAEQIEMAIDMVKNGLIDVKSRVDPAYADDPSHETDIADDDPYAEPFDAPFDEPFEESYTFDNDPHAEPFDAPFDEPFDPSVGYPMSAEMLDDRMEEAYGDMADVQNDMYDAEQSLEDMVDDPMYEPEPEDMDPMDDPLHPYMPFGFPFMA